MFPLPRNASGVRDEFLHLDFPVPGELYNFSQHPFMASVTRQLLEPLYLAFIHVRDDWTWPIEARNPDERISMRKNTREYFELAARLSDLIIQHKALARDRRFPAPRVSWMQIVMRADAAYGFEGDEDAITRTILKGKLASVFRYADMLCHRAYERSTKAEALRRANGRPARGAAIVPEEGLPSVAEEGEILDVVSVDPMVQSQLEFFRTAHVERHESASSRNGHIQYLTQWVRPFAALIQCCIPLGALSSAEMPEGRVEFLQPYVVGCGRVSRKIMQAASCVAPHNDTQRTFARTKDRQREDKGPPPSLWAGFGGCWVSLLIFVMCHTNCCVHDLAADPTASKFGCVGLCPQCE
ncbi:hypothetical protein C8R47DRAFT_1084285 [Mycena vitilis]|nr:hypothetical protein C8R47DRAFT_1084285 [Mycena vitilis]